MRTFGSLRQLATLNSGHRDIHLSASDLAEIASLKDEKGVPSFPINDQSLPSPLFGAIVELNPSGGYTWLLSLTPDAILWQARQAASRFSTQSSIRQYHALLADVERAAKQIDDDRWQIILAVVAASSVDDAQARLAELIAESSAQQTLRVTQS